MSQIKKYREKLKELESKKTYYNEASVTNDGKSNRDRKSLQTKLKRIDKAQESTEAKLKSSYDSRNKGVLKSLLGGKLGNLPASAFQKVQSRQIIKEQKLRITMPEKKAYSIFNTDSVYFNDGFETSEDEDGIILRNKSNLFFS